MFCHYYITALIHHSGYTMTTIIHAMSRRGQGKKPRASERTFICIFLQIIGTKLLYVAERAGHQNSSGRDIANRTKAGLRTVCY